MLRNPRKLAWPIGAAIAMVVLWEVLSGWLVDPLVLPSPVDVADAFISLVQEPFFWANLRITLTETAIGFAIGVSVAFCLGTVIGLFDRARLALYPIAVAFENTPRVVFAPVFLTWFGFGLASKYMMVAAICFFPVLITVIIGLDTIDRDARTLMRSLGFSRLQTYRRLYFPSSLPIVFGGIKQAVTLSFVGAIVAEFVAGNDGLGVLVQQFNFQLQVADAFAVIFALMAMGLTIFGAVEWLDRRIVYWRGR